MSEAKSILVLADLMDDCYPDGWTYRTGVGVGTDIGPAIIKGLKTLRGTVGRGKIAINTGTWLLTTPIPPDLLSGNYIEGAGSQASILACNNNSWALYFSGAGGFTGGGARGLGILLEFNRGHSNAYGILIQGDAQFQPAQMEFDDIYMSSMGGSYWYNGLQINGMAKAVAPQGVRAGTVENMQIFNCRNCGIYLANAIQWTFENVGTYTGIGGGNDVQISGGGAALSNSTHVTFTALNCNGHLTVNNSSDVTVNGVKMA